MRLGRAAFGLAIVFGILLAPAAGDAQHLAAKNRLPVIHGFREFTEAGGLMSYGVDLPDNYRRAATYVDRILKDTKPAELPVEQPMRFELVINLKTAKALGLTIPPVHPLPGGPGDPVTGAYGIRSWRH